MIQLSEQSGNAMLDTLAQLLDGGSIELMDDQDRVLAVLALSNPATQTARAGELHFNEIGEEDAALAKGTAAMARIISRGGRVILVCDIGDLNSDAVVKLNTTTILRGGPVRLRSFKLVMP